MHKLQRSWVRSQHPSAQWNLRGGRWSSAEYCTNKKKKNPPKKCIEKKIISRNLVPFRTSECAITRHTEVRKRDTNFFAWNFCRTEFRWQPYFGTADLCFLLSAQNSKARTRTSERIHICLYWIKINYFIIYLFISIGTHFSLVTAEYFFSLLNGLHCSNRFSPGKFRKTEQAALISNNFRFTSAYRYLILDMV
jgi:hypothetical protein